MGKRAAEALDIDYEGLVEYLHYHHSIYMRVDDKLYYLTDCNYEAWRAQDTAHRNHKNHYKFHSILLYSFQNNYLHNLLCM